MKSANRYAQIIERIFFDRYQPGMTEVDFEREDLEQVATALNIKLPKNLGDLIYTFRYRGNLPQAILNTAPRKREWIIRPSGRGKYRFALTATAQITPRESLIETKIPDATPGIISLYALSDEQALLAVVRYNRLIDVFTGVACYSLQNHLRTTVPEMGQVETDELYIGLDKAGRHYVMPVQAKGGKDRLSAVQIEQDFAVCRSKFPDLIARPIGAQFMDQNLIALFEFKETNDGIKIVEERHYRLTPIDQLDVEKLPDDE